LWKQIRLGWFIAVLCWPLLVTAQTSAGVPTAWSACFREAGTYYGLAPDLLIAIAQVESQFDPGAQHSNHDGSWDIGLMQINTRWLPVLQDAGIAPESLYEPCTSIWIGAWVLARAVAAHGYTWTSVGTYKGYRGRSEVSLIVDHLCLISAVSGRSKEARDSSDCRYSSGEPRWQTWSRVTPEFLMQKPPTTNRSYPLVSNVGHAGG
jgi:hypothetical protein